MPMPDLSQYNNLIIFTGMWVLVLYALMIAHDLAKSMLKLGLLPSASPLAPAPVQQPTPAPADGGGYVWGHGPIAQPTAPTETPVVDAGLVAFVKREEGFRAKAYWDYKQYSIGFGTKATSSTEVITEAEAEARLTTEIAKAEQLAEQVIPANAPKGVKQALTDLTYNAGSGWETQALGTAIKSGDYQAAKNHILAYNHAGGVVNAGLTARREAEVSWFDHPL